MKISTLRSEFFKNIEPAGIWLLAASFLILPAKGADSKDKPKAAAGASAAKQPAAKSTKSAKNSAVSDAATVNGTGKPSIIDFSAVWCVPCKKFNPIYEKVANDFRGRVDFFHVDVDDPKHKAVVDKYKVEIMPTIVFRDAKGAAKYINQGPMEEATLVKEVNNLLK